MVYYFNICCKKNGCDTSVKLKEWFGLLSTYASLALVDKFGCNFFIQSSLHHMKMFTEKLEQTFFCPQYIWNCQCLIGVIKDCNMCVCVQEKFWPSMFPALFSKHETTCASMSSKSGQKSLHPNWLLSLIDIELYVLWLIHMLWETSKCRQFCPSHMQVCWQIDQILD